MFALAYNNTLGDDDQVSIDSFKKYFLPRVKIENYNIEIDARNFCDQQINDSIKQYDEIRKISTGRSKRQNKISKVMITQLVVYWISLILKKKYRLIAADLSKHKALDAD